MGLRKVSGSLVRSPRKGHTIGQLRALSKSNFYNADTGTELSASEATAHLHHLEQKRSDKITAKLVKDVNAIKTRSRGRAWIPKGEVVFRRINGHNVPFRKKNEPFL